MRQFLAVVFLFFLAFSLPAQTESSREDSRAEGLSLLDAIKEVEKRYGVKLSYKEELLARYRVSGIEWLESAEKVLQQLTRNFPLEIKKVREVWLIVPQLEKNASNYVKGVIADKESGETLPFAVVRVKGSNEAILTDPEGRFSIPKTLADSAVFEVSFTGYSPIEFTAADQPDGNWSVQLTASPTSLGEVMVQAWHVPDFQVKESGEMKFNAHQFASFKALGEPDVLRNLQLLPGVSANGESIGNLKIRGANSEQYRVLYDEIPIYHLDHFFGMFSTVIPDAVNEVTFYKSNVPVEYAGRTAGLVSMESKNELAERFNGSAGLNLMNAYFTVSTPVGKKTTARISARRAFSDVLSSDFFEDIIGHISDNDTRWQASGDPEEEIPFLSPDFYFYDFQGSILHRTENNTRLKLSFFGSQDYLRQAFELEDSGIYSSYQEQSQWGNKGISFSAEKPWSARSRTQLVMAYTSFQNDFFTSQDLRIDDLEEEEPGQPIDISLFGMQNNYLHESNLRATHQYSFSPALSLLAGTEIQNTHTSLLQESDVPEGSFSEETTSSLQLYSAFTDLKWKPAQTLSFQLGNRVLYHQYFENWYYEPRLQAVWKPRPQLVFRSSVEKHHQFMKRISVNPSGRYATQYWIAADKQENPVLEAWQYVVGGSYNFGNWSFHSEVYLRSEKGVREYDFVFDDSKIERDPLLSISGNGRSYGWENSLSYQQGNYTGMFSYSLRRSAYQIPQFNNGKWYASQNDQRHEIKFAQQYDVKNWQFSMNWAFESGFPYTPASGVTTDGLITLNNNDFNGKRLPVFHRLDIAAQHRWQLKEHQSFSLGVSIYNLYNHTNVEYRRFILSSDDDDGSSSLKPQALDIVQLGLTPNFFLKFEF